MRRGKLVKASFFMPKQTDFVEDDLEMLLNQQVANETASAYLYMSMAAWCDAIGLKGFHAYFDKQASEELKHAQKVLKFLEESGTKVVLKAIDPPPSEWKSVGELLGAYLEHERSVTANWVTIGNATKKHGNLAAMRLAQGFLEEQIEEEDAAVKLVQRCTFAGEGAGLLILDQEIGK